LSEDVGKLVKPETAEETLARREAGKAEAEAEKKKKPKLPG
jgi:hypothetical protein